MGLEISEGRNSGNVRSLENGNKFGVPTRGFTAYAKPGAAERTMINSGAGVAPGEP